jgi:hypothetical protein
MKTYLSLNGVPASIPTSPDSSKNHTESFLETKKCIRWVDSVSDGKYLKLLKIEKSKKTKTLHLNESCDL